ncbi:hypothetical protein CORT_0D02480 [Candida orthopsilosis Co 90-125]|uniref:TBP-associated factor 12 n=1 Tax=Candida orthopsilosis (strain 90-125) TaxID=1136231 RepID=H8X503_CANO9|nr:hypothetical protein CORT_0D02480 [Candida orthopsilosis Co 90-125]CCG23096.1 hypothetical protein CORT_0D02480 [Candida orthopsilosis Co 90-125]
MINNNTNGVHNQIPNGQMNQNSSNGVQNQSLPGGQQQRVQQQNLPQQQNLQNIPPQQLAQLVQAMKNDFEIAKSATDEQVKQHHLNRAENIRRVLARYQAQRNRLQQQQQLQQRQMNSQSPHLGGSQSGLQPQSQSSNQANLLSQQNLNGNNSFNQFANMPQGSPVMNNSPAVNYQSPGLDSNNIPPAISTMPKSRQPQVSQGSKGKQEIEEQSKQKLQQQHQQQQIQQSRQINPNQAQSSNAQNSSQQYRNMLTSMSSSNSSGAGSGTAGSINLPSNTISMEKFNQIRQKLTEIQRKIQLLEQSKKAGNATPEQVSIIDRELVEYRTKFQQFQKIGIYMRNQLVQQAKQQQQRQQGQNQQAPNKQGQLHQQQSHQQNTQPQSSPQLLQAPQHNQFPQPVQGNNQQFSPQMSPQQHNSFQGSPPPLQQSQQQQQQQQQQQLLAQHQRNIATGQQAVPPQLAATNMNGAALNQPLPHQSQQPSQAGTPAYPSAHPTPSQQIQQQVQIQSQRVPSRQASTTPQTQIQSIQHPSRQGSASSEKKPIGTGAVPTTSGTPNGSAAKSGSPGVEGRSTPQRPKSAMALNLAGITKPSVPSIPISSSVDIKPPAVVTFNPVTDTRPTLTGGGANSLSMLWDTPAITKLPTFDLEGGESTTESGRVLNKRKLQDIINTVGVDEGDGKTSIDGNVEELLLDLADEFIYSVTSFACRLAKHRKVDSIDAKDVQLHLDQNWNIKIPGYAMDEIRSTRKYQPSTSYNQKVQGIEISKAVNDEI